MRAPEPGTPGELRSRLNALVLAGTKTATTGLLQECAQEAECLEYAGERPALPDDHGRRVATVEITSVEIEPFEEVTWEHAAAEGEGDAFPEEWREGHRRFWERTGTPVTDRTPVTCLAFRLAR